MNARMLRRALLLGATVTGLAAPSALAAPQMVANVMPGPPSVSPSGNIASLRLDCAATDTALNLVRVEIDCWTSNGASASAEGAPAAFVDKVEYVGGVVGIAFTSFTFCARATSYYADGTSTSTPTGCVADDFGFATVL